MVEWQKETTEKIVLHWKGTHINCSARKQKGLAGGLVTKPYGEEISLWCHFMPPSRSRSLERD
jgi:hypothetical protein